MKAHRLTRKFIEDATRYVRAGVPLDVVARLLLPVAVADEFFRWLAIGTDPAVEPQLLRRKIYKDFAQAIDRAGAECEARHAALVQRGGAKWSAWWLARRVPSRWGPKATVRHVLDATTSSAAFQARIAEIKAKRYDPRELPDVEAEPVPPSEPTPPEPKEGQVLDAVEQCHPGKPDPLDLLPEVAVAVIEEPKPSPLALTGKVPLTD